MTSNDAPYLRHPTQPVTHAMPGEETPPQSEALPEAGMDTGSDEGSPGEREAVDPGDPVAAAVQDDAPLPTGEAPADGSPDGLDPGFSDR